MTHPIPDAGKLLELAEIVLDGKGCDNELDVQVEIALFKPGTCYSAVRANAAGTKVIYTDRVGHDVTCWAEDWTQNRVSTASALRARAQASPEPAIEGEGA